MVSGVGAAPCGCLGGGGVGAWFNTLGWVGQEVLGAGAGRYEEDYCIKG